MGIINMIGYHVTEFEFKNNVPSGTRLNLQTKYRYNVKFSEGGRCRGEINAEMADRENPEGFRLRIVIAGVFNHKADAPKPNIHVETFKALYPFARAYVATSTSGAGIPPVMLPEIDIESQNIYSFENPIKPGGNNITE